MPLYEYECDACGHRFEVIQKFSDPPVEKCPVCAGGVHKLQSAPAIQFKGTGWYVTDYAKKDGGSASKPDSGTGAPATEKTEKSDKTEKSGAKTETSASPAAPAAKDKPSA